MAGLSTSPGPPMRRRGKGRIYAVRCRHGGRPRPPPPPQCAMPGRGRDRGRAAPADMTVRGRGCAWDGIRRDGRLRDRAEAGRRARAGCLRHIARGTQGRCETLRSQAHNGSRACARLSGRRRRCRTPRRGAAPCSSGHTWPFRGSLQAPTTQKKWRLRPRPHPPCMAIAAPAAIRSRLRAWRAPEPPGHCAACIPISRGTVLDMTKILRPPVAALPTACNPGAEIIGGAGRPQT